MNIWNIIGLPSHRDILQLQQEIQSLKAENTALYQAQKEKLETIEHSQEQFQQFMQNHITQLQEECKNVAAAVALLEAKQKEVTLANTKGLKTILARCDSTTETLYQNQKILEDLPPMKEYLSSLLEGIQSEWNQDLQSLKVENTTSHQAQKEKLETIEHIQEQLCQLTQNQATQLQTESKKIAKTMASLEKGQKEVVLVNAKGVKSILTSCDSTTEILLQNQKILGELPSMKEYLFSLWEAMKLVWIQDLIDMKANDEKK